MGRFEKAMDSSTSSQDQRFVKQVKNSKAFMTGRTRCSRIAKENSYRENSRLRRRDRNSQLLGDQAKNAIEQVSFNWGGEHSKAKSNLLGNTRHAVNKLVFRTDAHRIMKMLMQSLITWTIEQPVLPNR